MFGIGMGEFLIILIVGLIVFGPKNLPEVGKTLGKGLKEFRKAQAALSATLEESVNEPVKKNSSEVKTAEEKISLDEKLAPEFSQNATDKSSDTAKQNAAVSTEKKSDTAEKIVEKEIPAPPKELYTGTVDEKKSEEPVQTTVDDLITAVKENPISNKSSDTAKQNAKVLTEKN